MSLVFKTFTAEAVAGALGAGEATAADPRVKGLTGRIILRVRHTIIKAIRDFFDNNDFVLVDAPDDGEAISFLE